MGFIATSSFLLVMEIVSPCKYLSKLDNLINSSLFAFFSVFGWWHGISLLATIMLNLTGTRMLHYYSTRMVNTIWLHRNGHFVDIEFLNAFFVSYQRSLTTS